MAASSSTPSEKAVSTPQTTETSQQAPKPQGEVGTRYLEGTDLVKSIIGLNVANAVSFVDLVGVTACVSVIGQDFNAESTIAWASTAQLIGACVGQCIMGYLSDLWSRRRMLQIACLLLCCGAVACGASRYSGIAALFYTFRAISGIACGSISNLVNIAQNDFLPASRRLKWQGVQSTSIAIGSIIGVTSGAGFASIGSWQALYWLEAGLAFFAFILVCLFVPANSPPPGRGEVVSALKSIDYLGIFTGAGAIVPGLVMICEGTTLPDSVLIALGVVTGLFIVAFLYLGFKDRDIRPIVPFHLFRNRTIAAIFFQNILFGAAYYSFTYFLPLSFQVDWGFGLVRSAVSMIPYFVTHGAWGTWSALVVRGLQQRGHRSYTYMFYFGFGVWMLADGLIAWDAKAGVPGLIYFLEVLVGLGTGSTFTNSVMAIRAQVQAQHNAVAVGTRNVLRFFGGALGTAISSVVLSTQFKKSLPARLQYLGKYATSRIDLSNFSASDRTLIQNAYSNAVAWVFYVSLIFLGGCFLFNFLIKDQKQKKVVPNDEEKNVEPVQETEKADEEPRAPSSSSDSDSKSIEYDCKTDDDHADNKSAESSRL